DEVIEVMAKNDKISKSLHLPVQAGSDKILKAMNRSYDTSRYFTLIDKVKKAMPNITLSTDIIVGFPDETEEDYQKTVELIKKVRYHNAFIFMYSKRKGTIAEQMDNQVSLATKHERISNLLEIQHEISTQLFNEMVGTTQRVLVESENNMFYISKTQCGKIAKISKSNERKLQLGNFYDCKIIEYKNGNLIGRID
ncbi:MAG: radical SAM protein, partial [Clostridia bacterium]|nr:radical SAM protein [Clostridia bacterium]